MMTSSIASSTRRLLIRVATLLLLLLVSKNTDVVGLATKRQLPSRRAVLCLPFVVPTVANAAIDVSSLKVEANPLDVFLGGTYFEDSSDDRVDGRLARRKYTIVETKQQSNKAQFFDSLESRPVRILSESTAISSSRDDALELTGNLYLCKEHGGCISIDFSPLGGKVTNGYWDASETSIRFDDRVWSKQ